MEFSQHFPRPTNFLSFWVFTTKEKEKKIDFLSWFDFSPRVTFTYSFLPYPKSTKKALIYINKLWWSRGIRDQISSNLIYNKLLNPLTGISSSSGKILNCIFSNHQAWILMHRKKFPLLQYFSFSIVKYPFLHHFTLPLFKLSHWTWV